MNATIEKARLGYEWAITITLSFVLGPVFLPYTLNIATQEETWPAWAITLPPMAGLLTYAYAGAMHWTPMRTVVVLAMLFAIGVLMVLVERAGFRGFR